MALQLDVHARPTLMMRGGSVESVPQRQAFGIGRGKAAVNATDVLEGGVQCLSDCRQVLFVAVDGKWGYRVGPGRELLQRLEFQQCQRNVLPWPFVQPGSHAPQTSLVHRTDLEVRFTDPLAASFALPHAVEKKAAFDLARA